MRLLSLVLMSSIAVGAGGVALAASPPKTPAAPADPAPADPAPPATEAPEAPGDQGAGDEAPASDGSLLTFADPDVILDVAKGYGSANLQKDGDGNPQIAGRIEGVKYSVLFYGCSNGANCRSIQFSTGYTDPFTPA